MACGWQIELVRRKRAAAQAICSTLAIVVLYSAPAASRGAECTSADTLRYRGFTARLENDLFAGTDRNYTNGIALALVSHDVSAGMSTECLPNLIRLHANMIRAINPGFWDAQDESNSTWNVVTKFGQSMYTPENHTRTDLVVDDRPYAGLLYSGLSWNRRMQRPDNDTESLDTREITLGVIGPLSLAEEAQALVHDAIGSPRFEGWAHQLGNEPAIQLAIDRKFKARRGEGAVTPGFSADAIQSVGLRLGNIETSAMVGIEARVGWNIPNDFGSYPIRPGAENRPPSAVSRRARGGESDARTDRPRAGVHAFLTVEAKAVAYDFSLDGNLLRDSHAVDRRPWVLQAAVGVAAQGIVAGRGVRLALMHVQRTREFEEQEDAPAYGSIAVSIEF